MSIDTVTLTSEQVDYPSMVAPIPEETEEEYREKMARNPILGAIYWERTAKVRINSSMWAFEPCTDDDEGEHELTGHRVSVNGKEIGTLLYDPATEKHFRLEPILYRDGQIKGYKRAGAKKSLYAAALDMAAFRMDAEFQEALS